MNLVVNTWLSLKSTVFIHGHHHYQTVWTPELGESLICERELTNPNDRYAVAILKDDIIVGHLRRAQSKIYSLFLHKNGTIDCTVTVARRYSADLPQFGLEIPCKLVFNSKHEEIKKLKRLLARKTVVN